MNCLSSRCEGGTWPVPWGGMSALSARTDSSAAALKGGAMCPRYGSQKKIRRGPKFSHFLSCHGLWQLPKIVVRPIVLCVKGGPWRGALRDGLHNTGC